LSDLGKYRYCTVIFIEPTSDPITEYQFSIHNKHYLSKFLTEAEHKVKPEELSELLNISCVNAQIAYYSSQKYIRKFNKLRRNKLESIYDQFFEKEKKKRKTNC